MSKEKRAVYTAASSYSTQNELNNSTQNIWLIFHGMGYLSRYFLRYFSNLNAAENYLIAPQAPSKYYMGPQNKHVGASWLTKEDTLEETKNVLSYVDAVWRAEQIPPGTRLIVLGYSQGVSIATRWLASRKIDCDRLILHSGGIPKELNASHFEYLEKAKVFFHYGLSDQYITKDRADEEKVLATRLFGNRLTLSNFPGTHEVDVDFIDKMSKF